jgi:hypothetical protein
MIEQDRIAGGREQMMREAIRLPVRRLNLREAP